MKIESFLFSGFTANTFLCTDEQTNASVLIDPGTDEEAVLKAVSGKQLTAILLTHAHFDHALCAGTLREATGAPLYIHQADAPLLADPYKNASAHFGVEPMRLQADRLLKEGESISFGASALSVLHTPGHSPGSVCFVADGVLFCGDTLFADGVGRQDLFGGSPEALLSSLERLKNLDGEHRAYPGHGESFLLSRRFAQMPLW